MRNFIIVLFHRVLSVVIKSKRMRWANNVGYMGEMRNAYKILVGKSEGKRPLGRLGVDGRSVLTLNLKE
jgi:hypothetical protein